MMRTRKIHKERIRRCVAMLLTVCMVLQSGVNAVFAAVDSADGAEESQPELIPGLALPDGRCIHHPNHTEECGYKECSHVHTRECYEILWDCVLDDEKEEPDSEEASPSDAQPGEEAPKEDPILEASPSDANGAQGNGGEENGSGQENRQPEATDETEAAGGDNEAGKSDETKDSTEIGSNDEAGENTGSGSIGGAGENAGSGGNDEDGDNAEISDHSRIGGNGEAGDESRTDGNGEAGDNNEIGGNGEAEDDIEIGGNDVAEADNEIEENNRDSKSEEAVNNMEQDGEIGSLVLEMMLKPSESNENPAETKIPQDSPKASPADADRDDQEENDTGTDGEILDESDEDYEFDGEIDLINDVHICSEEEGCVIREIRLVCNHVHDEECGGADCTFECPEGCEKDLEAWLRSGIGKGELRTKEENLIAGEEYTYENLMELAEVVSDNAQGREEITRPVGIDQVVRTMAGPDGAGERQIIWDGSVNEAEELRIVPEEPQEHQEISYCVTYAYEDKNILAAKSMLALDGYETDGIAMMSLEDETEGDLSQAVGTFGVARGAVEYDQRYEIIPNLEGTVFTEHGDQDILEGVTVAPDKVIEGENQGNEVGVRVQNITREKPDATGMNYIPDHDYTWDKTSTVISVNPARRKYVITYEAYDTQTGKVLNEKTIWLMVAEAGDVGAVLTTDDAYITNAGMADRIKGETDTESAIVTGSAPFDNDDNAGNDSSPTNKKVRTYDIVSYKTMFNTGMHPDAKNPAGYKRGRLYFQYYIPLSKEQAQFEPDTMMWPDTRESCYYEIDEIRDGNGQTGQVMRGSFILTPTDENPAAIGASYQELSVVIRVYKMHNGDVIRPRFTYWLEGNDVGGDEYFETRSETWVNDDSDGDGVEYEVKIPSAKLVGETGKDCSHHSRQEYQTIIPDDVEVSAAPRFNIQINNTDSGQNQLLGTFGFNTGYDGAANKGKGDVYGRLGAYGVNLQIVGKSPDLGLRGVELPDANTPIEFDLELSSVFDTGKGSHGNPEIPRPLFWSIDENMWKGGINSDGRSFRNKEGNSTTSDSAAGGGPHNREQSGQASYNRCKNGGIWTYEIREDGTAHVKVTGFEVDLTHLPYADNGSSSTQFPNGYYNPEILGTGNVSGSNEIKNNYWTVQNAYISSGEVWAVQPFYVDGGTSGETIAHKFDNGSFNITLEAKNLTMKSENGKEVKDETTLGDNRRTQGMDLLKPGSIDNTVYYQKWGGNWNDPLTPGAFYNGTDWAVVGQKLQLEEVIWNDGAEGLSTSVAYDQLIKFDDQFFEPEWVRADSSFVKHFLWGAKKDKKGWDHGELLPDEEGYDKEMMEATADDLIFYESLDQLKKDGYVPVAALAEHRGVVTTGMNHIHFYVIGHVKTSARPGYVYMLTHNAVAWNKGDVVGKVKEELKLTCSDEQVTNDQYNQWLTTYFPTRSGNDHGYGMKYPDQKWFGTETRSYPATAYWMATHKGEKEREPNANNISNYEKVKYINNHAYDPKAGEHWGDSCLVMSYKSEISTQVAQKSNNASMKQKYDLSMNQRYADFVLYPSIVRETSTPSTGEDSKDIKLKTNVVVEVELPTEKAKTDEKGNILYENGNPVMEPYFPLNYISGSSYWGGNYEEVKSGQSQGVVSGGMQVEPVIDYKERGDGVLVPYKLSWHLNNVEFSAVDSTRLAPIYFTCEIGVVGNEDLDVRDGDSIPVTATIETTEDRREKISTNGNLSTVGISVLKDSSISLSQVADQIAVDQGELIGFTMNVGNNSVNDINNCYIVNGLPFNGDHSGSSFHGPVQVVEFSYGSEEALEEISNNFRFYYTTERKYQGVYSEYFKANSIKLDEDSDWHELKFRAKSSSDGEKSVHYVAENLPAPSNKEEGNIVAIVAYGTLPGGKTLKMHVTVNLPDGQQGDYVVNHLTRDEYMRAHAHSYIVSRQLEGLVWWDANQNGIQDYGEAAMNRVAVALMKLKDGKDSGSEDLNDYEFYKTEKGKYAVMLTGQQMDLISGESIDYTTQSPVEGSASSGKDPGHYRFYNLKEGGTFGVVFLDRSKLAEVDSSGLNAIDLTEYIASPRNAGLDNVDSDAMAVKEQDLLVKTFIPGIVMPNKRQLSTKVFTSRYHDSGLYSRKARIRFAKWIDNMNDPGTLGFDAGKLADDEFIVKVKEQGRDGLETGIVLNHAGVNGIWNVYDESKYSGYIEVLTSDQGTTYKIDEIVPKEYQKSATFLTYAPESFRKGGSLGADTVTVMPEEVVVVVVHNTFEHQDYFHDDARAMNQFPAKNPASGSRSVPVSDMAAIVPDRTRNAEEQLDEEQRLV